MLPPKNIKVNNGDIILACLLHRGETAYFISHKKLQTKLINALPQMLCTSSVISPALLQTLVEPKNTDIFTQGLCCHYSSCLNLVTQELWLFDYNSWCIHTKQKIYINTHKHTHASTLPCQPNDVSLFFTHTHTNPHTLGLSLSSFLRFTHSLTRPINHASPLLKG